MGVMRIGMIGSAGLGKSTVASRVGAELGLYFLPSKEITRPVLRKYGYEYGMGMNVEDFLSRKEIEFELVDGRIYNEGLLSGGFVTDRTTLECFCYALMNLGDYGDDDIALLESMCRGNMSSYTRLFYFPRSVGWMEDNGLRTTSEFYQRKVDMIIRGLAEDWGIRMEAIPPGVGDVSGYVIGRLVEGDGDE